ncbi:hypothetical protein SBV1_2010025 [Verrucomicrobia bacterium]|nr:hypothetical protein SBV1_2010025 [Verrucomicrobiota bacterium]
MMKEKKLRNMLDILQRFALNMARSDLISDAKVPELAYQKAVLRHGDQGFLRAKTVRALPAPLHRPLAGQTTTHFPVKTGRSKAVVSDLRQKMFGNDSSKILENHLRQFGKNQSKINH